MTIEYPSYKIEVTVDQIIEAVEQNGFIHCRNGWFKKEYNADYGERPINEACIMGQVAINLGVTSDSLESGLNKLGTVSNKWLKHFSGDDGYEFGIAEAAIQYNDGSKLSYNAIAKKLRDWLEPYRGKTLKMQRYYYLARRKNGELIEVNKDLR
jgi:hypothetical protein